MSYPKNNGLRLTALGLIAFTQFIPSISQAESFDTLTVTGNRMQTPTLLAPSSVITRTEIERLQIDDLPTLLSRQAGISVTNSGGVGQQSSIFMRGTESDHTLILVDGVKWYSATSGGAAIQDFPVDQIERIEIVRGPRSGLYGAEAIGGVINIITRQGNGETSPFFSAGIGSDSTQKVQAGLQGGNESTRYNLSVGHYHTDGIDALKTAEPDDDGYRNKNISGSVNHQLTDKLAVRARVFRAEARNEYDDEYNPNANIRNLNTQQVLQVGTNYQVSDRWSMDIQLAESRDKSTTEQNRDKTSEFNTRHRQIDIKNTFLLTDSQFLNVGLEYAEDEVDGTVDFIEDSRDNRAAYISWAGQYERHNWLVSARHDNNEAYGSYTSGSAEWGYELTEDLMFVANAGSAFKAPTFNDLYYPFSGNPNLAPEKSRTYGVGLKGAQNWGQWHLNSYQTEIRDLITYSSSSSSMENINKARIRGVELDLNTVLAGWDLGLNLGYVDADDRETDERLIRRARKTANLHADKAFGDWSYGASWRLNGDRRDLAYNNVTGFNDEEIVGGHGIVDLRMAYQVNNDWTVRLNVNNAFDKDYETVYGYNSLDRQVMLSVNYTP
ncbi:TonB-dependent receptor domain-containing protein [Methylophaga sp. OBS3]|uniref:TonB-dependent receptor domain-containing protein n=1 Tax=Methylophaga sp. OBS3 TaxID=2991934 RepID=UPI00224CEF9C|nr:TonB-dependent receptor [Methylophaga sp. OBS3]MCX4188906.1 TonB-dependent receptor [Methylophaga sp. OBS3]